MVDIDVYCDSSECVSSAIAVVGNSEFYFRDKHNIYESMLSEFYGILMSLNRLVQHDIPKGTQINIFCDNITALAYFNRIHSGDSISNKHKYTKYRNLYNDILHVDMCEKLRCFDINTYHVYGHSGIVYNEMCDKMCGNIYKSEYNVINNDYKYSIHKKTINLFDVNLFYKELKKFSLYTLFQKTFNYLYVSILPCVEYKINENVKRKMITALAYKYHLQDPTKSEIDNWLSAEQYLISESQI